VLVLASPGPRQHRPGPGSAELSDQLLALASPVGFYGEEMDPSAHARLGNYPRALTHVVLVQAALALSNTPAAHADRVPRHGG
jgi:GH15 family glucan-1,4-alpha-glucosidase